ncbi:MAG: sn-glycerol-3-phosphate ABC transporter ATP-binding protein UgpC [Opitutaceae bacterium]|nr:sn-glycerol-3-phosphate ABC transporter ATP-binding protein UgpC [Opitutaceae bacterium]
MAHVSIENLVKVYPEKHGTGTKVLHGINLEIRDREFLVLVGPSGCGKSTILRMIAGLESVTGGSISIDGRIVNDVPPRDRDIAMVFQNYALYPHMSVYDNMAFGLKLRKFSKAEIDARVREASSMLGLGDYLDRKPRALSGGQRQRVAVGRAIVRKPKVFLFDEPLSNLDAKMRVSTRTDLSKLHARLDATMIYVTHDQAEAMTMGDRICVLKEGHLQQVAAPLELYNQPDNMFVAGFIGSPPMNLFKGTVRIGPDGLFFVEATSGGAPLHIPLTEDLARRANAHVDKPVAFGIRPENIHVLPGNADCPQSSTADVRVDVSEPMGSETLLYLSTAATSFVARVHPTDRHQPGQVISVSFDTAKAHLFDDATGCVIRPG